MSHLKHLKRHQLELIRCNRKLCFYSLFKTDVSKSHYLEQIKNLKHSELWLNYDQAIIVSGSNRDDTVYLNYLNVLEFGNTATLTKLRTKIISYLIVIAIKLLDNK